MGLTSFDAHFYPWWYRPDRTQEWYNRLKEKYAHVAGHMEREYPSNDTECFEFATGRIYPQISRATHFETISDQIIKPPHAKRYRSLDFGTSAKHPFVCLWLWHDQYAKPRLTFAEDCEMIEEGELSRGKYPAGLEEMFAYSRDDRTGRIIKDNDHVPDALRYAVTTFRMTGHVHVYRVLYIRPDDSMPARPLDMFHSVLELSGYQPMDSMRRTWVPGPGVEYYDGTVGDRSGSTWMQMAAEQGSMGHFQLSIIPHDTPAGQMGAEVENGIAWVSALASGSGEYWELLGAAQEAIRGGAPGDSEEKLVVMNFYKQYVRGMGRKRRTGKNEAARMM